MQLLSLVTVALGIGLSIASPTLNRVRHEKREASSRWIQQGRAMPETELLVRIALSQSNMDLAHSRLMEISDPRSEKYGQHMSAEEVGNLFRPSRESVDQVREWLHDSGIDMERHSVSPGRGWLKFEASVDELETLLATEYHIFHHLSSGEDHIGCNEYHLPKYIQEHVEFITPAVSFVKVASKNKLKKKDDSRLTSLSPASLRPKLKPAPQTSLKSDIELPCYVAVTPDCIRELYNIPTGTTAQPGNEIGIFENGDYYDQEDLDLAFQIIAPYIPNGTHPTLHGINGGVAPLNDYIGVESLLDMSIILPLVWPQKSILFQVDDLREVELSPGFGDTFLDALDASYCTFDGGDDPNLDPHYPDLPPYPANETGYANGTWGQPKMCGAYRPTNVISVSYGLGEDQFSYHYENRQCQEYLKLGLQGVSVIYASGDSGVSNRGECIEPKNASSYPVGSWGAFSPSFPAACPYLTSVGGTMLNNTAELVETAVSVPAEQFWSGGGFSNYWPAPDYQASTISSYFKNTPPPYTDTVFGTPVYNSSGRGYPDVAALGLNIFMYTGGIPYFAGGTSASAPIFASIVTLINEQRLAAGKSTVGFLNPTLYQNPDAFNDITTGNNPGCGTNGFDAVKGWDPVTGLGTPIFDKLLEIFLALP
ncbi:putative protease S8 tripeptidyl peptidase I [Xylogone sp. PMI_703]|nr:putative protease S8 tripeptidyl peptidase I [Xylogone sp. PMI_703]